MQCTSGLTIRTSTPFPTMQTSSVEVMELQGWNIATEQLAATKCTALPGLAGKPWTIRITLAMTVVEILTHLPVSQISSGTKLDAMCPYRIWSLVACHHATMLIRDLMQRDIHFSKYQWFFGVICTCRCRFLEQKVRESRLATRRARFTQFLPTKSTPLSIELWPFARQKHVLIKSV